MAGYYEHEADDLKEAREKEQQEKERLIQLNHETPEWIEWNEWKRAFLTTSFYHLNVGQFLRGLKKLEQEPWFGKVKEK